MRRVTISADFRQSADDGKYRIDDVIDASEVTVSETKLEYEAGSGSVRQGRLFNRRSSTGSRSRKRDTPIVRRGWLPCITTPRVCLSDYPAAAVWYKKAAEGGNVFAQNNLATMYVAGQGVEKNYGEAAKWLAKAAEKSDPYAIFNLASLYDKGEGVEKNPTKAAGYYRSAAELGHVPSQSRLGYMYANGIGVARNRVEAFVWLSLAAQHGIGTALVALESVVQAMSAEEKLEGQRLLDVRRRTSRSLLEP